MSQDVENAIGGYDAARQAKYALLAQARKARREKDEQKRLHQQIIHILSQQYLYGSDKDPYTGVADAIMRLFMTIDRI